MQVRPHEFRSKFERSRFRRRLLSSFGTVHGGFDLRLWSAVAPQERAGVSAASAIKRAVVMQVGMVVLLGRLWIRIIRPRNTTAQPYFP